VGIDLDQPVFPGTRPNASRTGIHVGTGNPSRRNARTATNPYPHARDLGAVQALGTAFAGGTPFSNGFYYGVEGVAFRDPESGTSPPAEETGKAIVWVHFS
jgi:hypothetical protein